MHKFQNKNKVVTPPVTPKEGRRPVQKIYDILNIILKNNLNSKINLKITVEFRMFNPLIKLRFNAMICE
jgi:hypothetical protein